MEKVEKILAAEEAARHTVAEARDESVRVRRNADGESRRILEEAESSATEEAAAVRSDVLAAAEAEADRIAADSSAGLESSLEKRRALVAKSAARMVEGLAGQA